MALQPFTIEALKDLDLGKVPAAFNRHVREIVDDLNDRPELDKARKLVMTVTFAPEEVTAGGCETVKVGFEIKTTMPSRRTRDYSMRASRAGLTFNPESPEDARQMTIDEAREETRDDG